MTIHITTGPSPGHPGACIAQYNHQVFNHTLHPSQHINPHNNYLPQYIQHSNPNYNYLPQYIQHSPPAWIPPVSTYSPFY